MVYFFLSNLDYFYFFFFSAVARTSNTVLNKSGKNGHSFLVTDFRGNTFDFSPLSMTLLLQSHVCLFATPWTAAYQASLSFTISLSLLKLISIESVMPSNHLILCHLLLLLPSIFPSIKVFSGESVLCIRWPKYWSLSFSISPSSDSSGLISFRIDQLDLPVDQKTFKSLL